MLRLEAHVPCVNETGCLTVCAEVSVPEVRPPIVVRSEVLALVTLIVCSTMVLAPGRAAAGEPPFESTVIDGLSREEPLALAALSDGAVLAVWQDGSARTYWPTGRALDELLPLRFTTPGLPPLPRTTFDVNLRLILRPFYMPDTPYGMMTDFLGNYVPWEHTRGGETLLPWVMKIRVRDFGWGSYATRFYAKPPPAGDRDFSIGGCHGGGAVLLEDGQLSARFGVDDEFQEFATHALLPSQATLRACERVEDALHAVIDVDSVPLQARYRELRLTREGGADMVPRPERKVQFPGPPAAVADALLKLTGRGDLNGCEARDDSGATLFAWYLDDDVETISASVDGVWVDVAHFEGSPKFACQSGGRGLFVASDRGLYLVAPANGHSTAVTGAAPAMLGSSYVRTPRLRGKGGFSTLQVHPAIMPSRLQLVGGYSRIVTSSDEEFGNGGPMFRFTDQRQPTASWEVVLSVQWNLGSALPPYTPRSDDRSRLESLTSQLNLTNAVAASVGVYPGTIQRRSSQEVWEALNQMLRTEEY